MASKAASLQLTEEEYSAAIAGGKVLTHLMDADHNQCGLSPSIYDAALVMPQITRSSGNPRALINLSVRSYFFLVLNFVFQIFILYMIATEEEVMDKFGGQMNLCDFGANVQSCPGGPNCIGPAGTNYENAGRMYSYEAWALRTFMRDSMKQLFPDKAEEIDKNVDPGEYGVENAWVRYVCVFIFMMSVNADLRSTVDFSYILYFIPSANQPWLSYDMPDWAGKDKVKQVSDSSEVDFVKFKIAGMSRTWKLINLIIIIIPKLFIWKKTAKYGVMFLMETAGIEDVIVNVTALTFILNLDEMLFEAFSHKCVHHILEHLEPWELEETEHKEDFSLDHTYEMLLADRKKGVLSKGLIPWRFCYALFWTAVFMFEYYAVKCEYSERGGLVSKQEELPLSAVYPASAFIIPYWPTPSEGTPYWSRAAAP